MTRVVLVGSGGHAKVVLEILRAMGGFEVVGVTTTNADVHEFCGVRVLGTDEVLLSLVQAGIGHAAIGVGGFRNNEFRRQLYSRLKDLGFRAVTAIHPHASVSPSAVLGEGSVVFPGAVLNSQVCVGRDVIIATGATVDHETLVEDHALISAGVTVGADAIIREGAMLAIGSTVVSGIEVGRNALVAAGAVVVRNVADGLTVYGIPAAPKVKEMPS